MSRDLHGLLAVVDWPSFLSASASMAVLGLLTCLLVRASALRCWRVRSWLVGAVLLQGLMVVRAPVHLGLIPSVDDGELAFTGLLDGMVTAPDPGAIPVPEASAASASRPPMEAAIGAGVLAAPDGQQNWIALLGRVDWLLLAWWVWVSVMLAIVAVALVRYVRVLGQIRRLPTAPKDWRQAWHACLRSEQVAVRCEMRVSQSAGPLLVRRPRGYVLVVPEEYWRSLHDDQRRGVMLHELAHLKRRDVWRHLAARLVAALHWFNPVAWWALREYELAAECACDARVAAGGKRAATGFASALIELVQFQQPTDWDRCQPTTYRRSIGVQTMSAPPLNTRISRLLASPSTGDSTMKRRLLIVVAFTLVLVSFFQVRLTTAQEGDEGPAESSLRVISDRDAGRLNEVGSRLDPSDPTTERLAELFQSPSGKIAIAGLLNALEGRSREEARSEAVPRFFAHHFISDAEGKLVLRAESQPASERWTSQAERLADSMGKITEATEDIASRMDTSTEAGGLFKRLLQDRQAPVAVLMSEMKGGDVIARYLAERLDRILVDQGNGTFRIVQSQRDEATRQVETFERADKLSVRLRRELPNLAAEYAGNDEAHEKLIRYLKNPLTASVVAMQMAGDTPSAAAAIDKLYEHFEGASIDTPDGLKIAHDDAWDQLEKMFERVDRAAGILPRTREKLAEIAETLADDDPLEQRLAVQMKGDVVPVLLAAELPYAEADPGEELRALLSEVLTESNGKLSINEDRAQEVAEKSRELLKVCRRIRRYVVDIDEALAQVVDQELVDELGDAGRYTLLDEVRRFAERHQPDPITLMSEELLIETDNEKLRVREERRELVRKLVEQSERVRAEAAKNDF